MRDIHQGRRAFLIANGPGLQIPDLDRLQNEITFGSNKIFLAFDQTDWRPTYLTVSDYVVAENIREELKSLSIAKVFGHATHSVLREDDDIVFCNPPPKKADVKKWDLISGVSTGHSVIYWDLQLAWWMGIREVYVTGLDFFFDVQSKRTGKQVMGNEVLITGNESNHFHPDYRKPGERWTMPRLDKQRLEFQFALEKYKADGGCIYNVSRTTKLDVWPIRDFDELFGQQA